jgi:hypothetical protein
MAVKPSARPADEAEVGVEVPAATVSPARKLAAEETRLSLIDQMREYFKTQKRVRVKVRNDADVPVQINGYTFIVQANVSVDVPEDVARLLEDAGYI